MISTSLSSVLELLDAKQIGEDATFTGVSIDSRTIANGNLYFALSGENFDGHTFCAEASIKGAAALVVEREQDVAVPQLVVANCREALRDLAIYWRKRFNIPFVAVTGSSGKTTVKEMIFSIFSQNGKALSTQGNLNNELGVPLTLLRLSQDDRRAVIEIGASDVGEIARIVEYVCPTIAVITMIGPAHLDGFGSIEAIVRAKSEIFSGLQAQGVAVINRDDEFYSAMRDAANSEVLTFGMSNDADVSATLLKETILLTTSTGKAYLKLPLLGVHNRQNALAATAVALAANFTLEEIVDGLESVARVPGRLQVRSDIQHFRVIDDTYNANPASVIAAIDVLDEVVGDCCLVLGDMAELGSEASKLHYDIGKYAAKRPKKLFCTGSYSGDVADGFGKGSVVCADIDALFKAFIVEVERGSNVLVKGSRSAGMERFIERISDWEVAAGRSEEVSL